MYNDISKTGIKRVNDNFAKEIRKQKLKKIVENLIK